MGFLFKPTYTKLNPRTGKRVKRTSKKWYIAYKDASGELIKKPACGDKIGALDMLRERESEVARGTHKTYAENLDKLLIAHVDDYADYLKSSDDTPGHVAQTKARILWILETGRILKLDQLTVSRVAEALHKTMQPKSDDGSGGLGAGVSTRNHYLTAIKGFAKWLVTDRRAKDSAIESLKAMSTKGKETKIRRPLTDEEFAWLLKITEKRESRFKISGPDRVALYLLAAFTGYRRNELATITPQAFQFGDDPRVAVPTEASKRDRPESIPIPREVGAFFQAYLKGRAIDQILWPIRNYKTADMLRADMAAAGLDTENGKIVVDFHSLRQNFITGLALAGVAPKIAQQLARHSTINLTMNTYAKVGDAQERAAVERLSLPKGLVQKLVQKRTRLDSNGTPTTPRRKQKAKPTDAEHQPQNAAKSTKKVTKAHQSQARKK